MLWRLLQLSIFGSVACANIYWQVTPNPYISGLAGLATAYGVTWLLTRLADLVRSVRRKRGTLFVRE